MIKETLIKNLDISIQNRELLLLDEDNSDRFEDIVNVILDSLKDGGTLYIAGNGGSAADAQHLAAELVGRFLNDRKPIKAIALTTDSSVNTAISNDYSFEYSFARQLQAHMNEKDVFLAISTSGNSSNIVEALRYTKANEFRSVLLTGKTGGKSLKLADNYILVPGHTSAEIQELHQTIYHSMVEAIEELI